MCQDKIGPFGDGCSNLGEMPTMPPCDQLFPKANASESPCLVCKNDLASEACGKVVQEYCEPQILSGDSGGSNSNGTDDCPYELASVAGNPCKSDACNADAESKECARVILDYCGGEGSDDPGCVTVKRGEVEQEEGCKIFSSPEVIGSPGATPTPGTNSHARDGCDAVAS